jgi:hypothetical protein
MIVFRVVYTQFSALIKRQKELLDALIQEKTSEINPTSQVHAGIGSLFRGCEFMYSIY